MIKFFRVIRQKLIIEGKTAKYFKYAIGEIILVVIGILIALQINNWNTQQKQLELERQYLISLKEEFSSNLEKLAITKNTNATNIKAAIEIAKHTGPNTPTISDENFAKLFYKALNNEVQYRPGNGIINEIISSGNLAILNNKELKKTLASLDGLMLKVRFQENNEVGKERNKIFELADKSVSLRKMGADAYGETDDLSQGKFLDSNLNLLQSREFDNLISSFIVTSKFLESNYYNQLERELKTILDIIENQLNQ